MLESNATVVLVVPPVLATLDTNPAPRSLLTVRRSVVTANSTYVHFFDGN